MADRFEQELFPGRRDKHIRFEAMRRYLLRLGFQERIRASHHIFSRPGMVRPLSLQRDGSLCKAYQVRQVRKLLLEEKLRLD